MNQYHDAMEHCAPDVGLRERLEQNVLSARPGKTGTFKSKGFRKKAAAVLLAAALVLTTGAASIWDPLLVRRFGPQAAMTYMGGATFQEVNLTSVCDDVSLTVTQALCSDKTIYILLSYKLPDGVQAEKGWTDYPRVEWYGTGDYTWEEYKALEGALWENYDWSDYLSHIKYFQRHEDFIFSPYRLVEIKSGSGRTHASSSGGMRCKGYDPETNTITWILYRTFDSEWNLTEQPLTLLVTPPCLENRDGTKTAVTDHPAIVTFQPAYNGPQSLNGALEDGDVKINVTLSPFALSLEAEDMDYSHYEDMVRDTCLIATDGTQRPASLLGHTGGGGGFGSEGRTEEVNTIVHFIEIVDPSQYTAVRMGNYIIPLE